MPVMKPEELFSTLSSETRLQILKILASGPKSIKEVKKALNAAGVGIKYRESVYKALEKLVSTGLVKKFYDIHDKKIKYSLAVRRIEIDLSSGKILRHK